MARLTIEVRPDARAIVHELLEPLALELQVLPALARRIDLRARLLDLLGASATLGLDPPGPGGIEPARCPLDLRLGGHDARLDDADLGGELGIVEAMASTSPGSAARVTSWTAGTSKRPSL